MLIYRENDDADFSRLVTKAERHCPRGDDARMLKQRSFADASSRADGAALANLVRVKARLLAEQVKQLKPSAAL
jgi:hypothetical protein